MLQRNASILWRELDGEAVLLSPSKGCSYNLNAVGTFIWKMLNGEHALDDLATAVCQNYEVEYEQARRDVEVMVAELREHDLVSELPAPRTVV